MIRTCLTANLSALTLSALSLRSASGGTRRLVAEIGRWIFFVVSVHNFRQPWRVTLKITRSQPND